MNGILYWIDQKPVQDVKIIIGIKKENESNTKMQGVHYICLTRKQADKIGRYRGINVVLLNKKIVIDVEREE